MVAILPVLLLDHPGQDLAEHARLGVRALAAERHEHVQARRAARLDEARQLDLLAELVDGPRDRDDVRERRALGVEVEDAPVRAFGRGDPAGPHVERDRPEVRDEEERFEVVADEVVDLALGVLAPDALEADPVGSEVGGVLLEEGLALDPVGIAGHDEGPVGADRAGARERWPR